MRAFFLPLFLSLGVALSTIAQEQTLFDGKTLSGWEGDSKWWSVKDGALTGGSTTEKVPHNYFLATTKSYHNFDLRLKIKLTGDPKTGMINSGVQIRSVRVPDNTEMSGYQVDAGDGWWGKLYDESRRNKVIATPADASAVETSIHKGDWNEYRIRAEGPRIQSWINGVAALDYTEKDAGIALDGHIAVQIHSGGIAQVQVKDITLEELPATPNAPSWDQVGRPKAKTKATASVRPLTEGNAGAALPKSPQEQLATFTVPDGFEVELVASEEPERGIGKFVAVSFDEKGRMWSMTALEYPVDGNENPAAATALYASRAKDKVLVFDTPFAPGPQKPRVYAEGLAIPLGILPYKNGCYAQHGSDIVYLRDTNADGVADQREVVLAGFGVQDSHLLPHQFTRAPGGWIWFAQGAFNYGKVKRPQDPPERALQFDQTRMAKFRPDGSGFDITSNGPCNIWGLVLDREGEAFIQEANDFGYPVMPFHEYANYPGCSGRQWKSYAPEYPGNTHFRLGGTGLSGLALTDAQGAYPASWADVMLVANPITRKINAIKLHRKEGRWTLEQLPDFITSTDEMFRPVALTLGPDGCVYIVDWYNKIISHNEVARTHPDRDKVRGRIWRVKAKGQPAYQGMDFTKESTPDLIKKLGSDSLAQSHLAWQTLADRQDAAATPELLTLVTNPQASTAQRIQALWALQEIGQLEAAIFPPLLSDPHRNLRREALRTISDLFLDPESNHGLASTLHKQSILQGARELAHDPEPEVRAQWIRTLGSALRYEVTLVPAKTASSLTIPKESLRLLFLTVKEPLTGPVAPSTHSAKNTIKVGSAYDREFERYLARMIFEEHPELTLEMLTAEDAKELSPESRLLSSLALPAEMSASKVAELLPLVSRHPTQEEILRLVPFIDQPSIAAALTKLLQPSESQTDILEALLSVRTRLDASHLIPLLEPIIPTLLEGTTAQKNLGIKLAAAFKLRIAERGLAQLVEQQTAEPSTVAAALQALGEIGSEDISLFIKWYLNSPDSALRMDALMALANSRSPDRAAEVLKLWPSLSTAQRHACLDRLLTDKPTAKLIVATLQAGTLGKDDLDAPLLERLQSLLPNDAELAALMQNYEVLFRPVLSLDGTEHAWTQTDISLPGACTIETWVRLDAKERTIGNSDGVLGAPGQLDLNFYGGKFRVYAYPPLHDVAVAAKPITPGVWTHVAATRSDAGHWKLYLDGESVGEGKVPAPRKLENLRIGWTTAAGGTQGALAHLRVWNRERSGDEIRSSFDRGLPDQTPGLIYNTATDTYWGHPQAGAQVIRTFDIPPVLSTEDAATLDEKFTKYRALASKPGNLNAGQATAALCLGCHLINGTGNNIGPNLSGVGAMGLEGILRNILTPNAAMESAYRIFRVELKNGTVKEGFLADETPEALVLRSPGVEDQRIKRSDIREAHFLRRSLMPEGLLEALSPQQVSDLFTYLLSLK